MKRRILRMLLVIMFCATYALVYGNDSFVADSGKTAYPINTDKVRMVSEKIKINMSTDGDHPSSASVECKFVFENISDETVSAKVGFPGREMPVELRGEDLGLENFTSEVNGQAVLVKRKEEILKTRARENGEAIPETQRYWYTWDVDFPPHERVVVKNSYETGFSGNVFAWSFEYILKTGANWNGPIEDAYIEVVYPDKNTLIRKVKGVKPEGYEIFENKIVWHFKDFTPDDNIRVDESIDLRQDENTAHWLFTEFIARWRGKHPYDGAERLYTENDLDIFQKHDDFSTFSLLLSHKGMLEPEKEFIKEIGYDKYFVFYLRNEIFARHGRPFESDFLRGTFTEFRWYKPDPDFTPDRLNDIEKKNVQFIVEYEKKKGWK